MPLRYPLSTAGTVGARTAKMAVPPPKRRCSPGRRAFSPDRDGQTVDIRIPMEFKVRGGRKEVILPPGTATAADVGPRSPLVVALARAHRWQWLTDSGEVPGVEAIAGQYGLDRTHVSRILGLAMLRPALVEAIAKGSEPSGLSMGKLMAGPFPLLWDEQRAVLGSQ